MQLFSETMLLTYLHRVTTWNWWQKVNRIWRVKKAALDDWYLLMISLWIYLRPIEISNRLLLKFWLFIHTSILYRDYRTVIFISIKKEIRESFLFNGSQIAISDTLCLFTLRVCDTCQRWEHDRICRRFTSIGLNIRKLLKHH